MGSIQAFMRGYACNHAPSDVPRIWPHWSSWSSQHESASAKSLQMTMETAIGSSKNLIMLTKQLLTPNHPFGSTKNRWLEPFNIIIIGQHFNHNIKLYRLWTVWTVTYITQLLDRWVCHNFSTLKYVRNRQPPQLEQMWKYIDPRFVCSLQNSRSHALHEI